MKLQVEQAKEHIGKLFPYQYTELASVLGDVAAFPWSRHDVTISGEFWYDGQNYIVKGTVKTEGEYACTRCLKPVAHEQLVPFEEAWQEYSSRKAAAAEGDELYCDGETIDLIELVRETLIINEPSQVLCQDDCKGLCPHCGADLNMSDCSCETDVIDPRFAVLRTMLDKNDD